VGESLIDSGIVRSQVVEMLQSLRGLSGVEAVTLLSFVSPRLYARRRSLFAIARQELRDRDIELILRITPAASNWPLSMQYLLFLWTLPIAWWIARSRRINVVHSRGYAAGLLAHWTSRKLGTRHLFDPRNFYPEEMVSSGRWNPGGATYLFWRRKEREIVAEAGYTIGVTPDYCKRYRSRGARRVRFVPSRTLTSDYTVYDSPDSPPRVVFVGEMEAYYYPPERIGRWFGMLKPHLPGARLVLHTRYAPDKVAAGLTKAGLEREEWSLSALAPTDLRKVIGRYTLALLPGREDGNWPVKYAEYLSAGVPVVIDDGLNDIIRDAVLENRLGIFVDPDDPVSFAAVRELHADLPAVRRRCRDYARRHLDISLSARQYHRLYRQLLSERRH